MRIFFIHSKATLPLAKLSVPKGTDGSGRIEDSDFATALRLVVDLQTCVKAQQSRAYARKVALSNLQEMARTIAYVQEHGMGTVDKLAEAAEQAEAQYKQASADLRETQNALTAVNQQIHFTGQYLSHKTLYRQFLSAENKGAFRAAHKDEIDEYEDAVSHLKATCPSGVFPSMKELKAEKTRLSRQRDQQRASLCPLTEQRKQMRVITGNVEAILGTKIQRERQQQKEV